MHTGREQRSPWMLVTGTVLQSIKARRLLSKRKKCHRLKRRHAPEKPLPQFIFYQLNQNWLCSALIVSYTAGIGSSSTLIALQRVWRSRRGILPRSSGHGRRAWVQTFQSKQNETQKSDFFHSLLFHHPQTHLTGSKWWKQSWQNKSSAAHVKHTVNQNHLNYMLSRKIRPGQLFPDALWFVFLKARHLFVVKENKAWSPVQLHINQVWARTAGNDW